MINNVTYGYPSQYGTIYGAGLQTPLPLVSSQSATNSAFALPQTQTGFSYQNPQFDTTAATTPDLNTVLQTLIAIVTQLIQTLGTPGTTVGKDQTGTGDNAIPTTVPSAGQGGGGCKGKANGKPGSNATPTPAANSTPASVSNDAGLSKDQQEFLDLVNKARKDAGLNPVTANAGMMKEATEYSQDIENAGGGLTHTLNGSQFGDRIKKGYQWHSTANENLAQGKTAKEAFDALMNDPPHRDNILSAGVTQIGVGHVGNTWTQDMAT